MSASSTHVLSPCPGNTPHRSPEAGPCWCWGGALAAALAVPHLYGSHRAKGKFRAISLRGLIHTSPCPTRGHAPAWCQERQPSFKRNFGAERAKSCQLALHSSVGTSPRGETWGCMRLRAEEASENLRLFMLQAVSPAVSQWCSKHKHCFTHQQVSGVKENNRLA